MIGHYIRVGIASRSLTGLMHDAVEDGWWPAAWAWKSLDAISRRDGETYQDYILRLKADPLATRIKLVDLVDNLTRNGGPSDSLRKRYRKAFLTLTDA